VRILARMQPGSSIGGSCSVSTYTVQYGDVHSVYYRVVGDSMSLGSGVLFSNVGCGIQPVAGVGLTESQHGDRDM
jgi:hypothetical protein